MENTVRTTPSGTGMSTGSEGVVDRSASSAHSTVDSIASAADNAVRKAKPTIDRATAAAHQAVDSAAKAAGPAAEWLSHQYETLSASQKKLIDDTCHYVAANPLKAVGIALAAGFVLGRILHK